MKTKTLGLFALSIFAVVLAASFISADTLAEWALTSDGTAVKDSRISSASALTENNVNIIGYTSTGANVNDWPTATSVDNINYLEVSFTTTENLFIHSLSFDHVSDNPIKPSMSFDINYSTDAFVTSSNIVSGATSATTSATYENNGLNINLAEGKTLTIRIYGYNADDAIELFSIKNLVVEGITPFCQYGAVNDSGLTLEVDIKNSGDDDDTWLPLNTVEVEVKLKNELGQDADGDDIDLDNVVFELGLFKKGSTTNIADDMIWISQDEEQFEFGDVNEGSKATHTFIFRIDPENIDEGDYTLMVKSYPDGDEDTYCTDHSTDLSSFGSSEYYADISVEKESDKGKMVVVDVDALPTPLEVSCGSEVTIYPVIFNIGDEDFPDQIKVSLYNAELGINMEKVILGDLDAGENTEAAFTFAIPTDADEKSYTMSMTTYYDYDEDDEEYDETSEDDFTFTLTIKEGTCIISQPASVSATIQSGGKAGEPLSISVSVTNTGSKTADYSVSAIGYSIWASSAAEDPSKIILDAGEEGEFTVTFDVLKSVSGEQEFELEIYSGGKLVATQPVVVPPIEKSGFSFLTGNSVLGDNWYIWAIGAFNLVLIVAIVIVAVKVAKRKRS